MKMKYQILLNKILKKIIFNKTKILLTFQMIMLIKLKKIIILVMEVKMKMTIRRTDN